MKNQGCRCVYFLLKKKKKKTVGGHKRPVDACPISSCEVKVRPQEMLGAAAKSSYHLSSAALVCTWSCKTTHSGSSLDLFLHLRVPRVSRRLCIARIPWIIFLRCHFVHLRLFPEVLRLGSLPPFGTFLFCSQFSSSLHFNFLNMGYYLGIKRKKSGTSVLILQKVFINLPKVLLSLFPSTLKTSSFVLLPTPTLNLAPSKSFQISFPLLPHMFAACISVFPEIFLAQLHLPPLCHFHHTGPHIFIALCPQKIEPLVWIWSICHQSCLVKGTVDMDLTVYIFCVIHSPSAPGFQLVLTFRLAMTFHAARSLPLNPSFNSSCRRYSFLVSISQQSIHTGSLHYW